MAQRTKTQQEVLSGSPQPNFTSFAPSPIVSKRNPTTEDLGYQIGQFWINRSLGTAFQLTNTGGGQALWVSVGGISDYPITPYVVGPVGQAGYQTIQSAINVAGPVAASTGQVQCIYIQPGTYTENLVLQSGLVFVGTGGFGFPNITTIIGTHIPPVNFGGGNVFRDLYLNSSGDLFSSSAVSSSSIILNECVTVANGYTFDLPNWTGDMFIMFCQNVGGGNDGIINNNGGANLTCFFSQLGNGGGFSANVTGNFTAFSTQIGCQMVCSGNATLNVQGACQFNQPVTMNGNSAMEMFQSSIFVMSPTALFYNSTATSVIISSFLNGSGTTIDGAGIGQLILTDFCCPFNFFYNPALNIEFSGSTISGGVVAGGDNHGVAKATSLSNVNSTTIGAGIGSISMSSANPATNAAWIKIYIGTVPYWIPAWTTNSP